MLVEEDDGHRSHTRLGTGEGDMGFSPSPISWWWERQLHWAQQHWQRILDSGAIAVSVLRGDMGSLCKSPLEPFKPNSGGPAAQLYGNFFFMFPTKSSPQSLLGALGSVITFQHNLTFKVMVRVKGRKPHFLP